MHQETSGYKYWAFISYSHQDRKWGDWLHKTLETYRVPRRLVGMASRDGTVPKRIFPVFRDREELPTSSDLGANLREALQQSRYLIVVCSPRSAVSRWVNEEIRAFKSCGTEDRVLCLIVDGEPNATDKPELGLSECFPETIRWRMDSQGVLTHERMEPIAADARPGLDGKAKARLKLIAGMLGVSYDELWQREKRRTIWKRVQVLVGAACLLATVSGVWQWQEHKKVAQARQSLIERYTEQGRQELLAANPMRALPYLSEAYSLGERRPALRFLLAQAMRPLDIQSLSVVDKENRIGEAKFSSDGKHFLTLHADKSVKVWELETGKASVVLGGKAAPVDMFDVSPDGRRVLTSHRNTATVWDSETGKVLFTLTGHELDIKSLTFSPDGRRIATASVDNTARIWDASNGTLLTTLAGHQATVLWVRFSPDASRLITTSVDETAKIWDIQTGKQIVSFDGSEETLVKGFFSPDGKRVATYTKGHRILVWDSSSGKLITTVGNSNRILFVLFGYPDAEIAVVSTDETNTVKIVNALNQRVLATFKGHVGQVVGASISKDRTRIVTASWDKTAKVWDLSGRLLFSFEKLGSFSPLEENILSASFSPDDRRVMTLNWGGKLTIWNAISGEPLIAGDASQEPLRLAFFSGDGSRIVTTSLYAFQVWNPRDRSLLKTFESKDVAVMNLFFTPDARRMAVATGDGNVVLWDSATGKAIATFPGTEGHFSSDGQRVLVTANNNGATIYDTANGSSILSFGDRDARVFAAALSPDGRRAVTISTDKTAKVWDVTKGKALFTLKQDAELGWRAVFSSDGERIVTVERDVVRIWNANNGKLLTSLIGHSFAVLHVEFSRDGQRIVTAGGDGLAKVWDVASGKLLANLECGSNFVNSVSFNPDGSLVLTASSDRGVIIWETATARALARIDGHIAAFSADGTQLLALSKTATLRDSHLEARSAEEIADIVKQSNPWRLADGRLVLAGSVRH